MKPAPFEYVAPASDEEALAALASYAGDARLLAGGQSLIPLLNLRMARPAALIDLGRCAGLDYIRVEDGALVFGPMTRQSAAERSGLVQQCAPLIAQAMPYLGHPTIRNRGTIGGTLAHADRVAELPGVAVALGAEMVALGPGGRRTIAAQDFYLGDLTNALQPDEMLREIRFPVSTPGSRSAFVEAGNRHHDLAIVGIAAQLELDAQGRCSKARIVAIGIAGAPARLERAEQRLAGSLLDDEVLGEAARACLEGIEPEGDTYASAAYRRHVTPGLVERALRQALQPEARLPA
jgi:carbon-monoxide dehydrogenase medium subunit